MTTNWIAILASFVVTGFIILGVFELSDGFNAKTIAAVQSRAARSHQIALIQMIETDFQNIAANYPSYDLDPDEAVLGVYADSAVFVSQVDTNAAGEPLPPVVVKYAWALTGKEVKLPDDTLATYTLTRYVDGKEAGTHAGSLTGFGVEMLDSQGDPAPHPTMARQFRVSFSLASSLGATGQFGRTTWESIIRPMALVREDYDDYLP